MSRQATQQVQSPAATSGVPDGGVGRSTHLDASLDKAHKLAVGQHQGSVTSEHLLFALTEDPEALVVLSASTVEIERLRSDISTHLSQLPSDTPAGRAILPSADLVKILKLAAMAAQQSSRRQIDGAIVLAAVIGDASTPSAGLLRAHGLTFNEVIRVLQKSGPSPQAATPAPVPAAAPAAAVAPEPLKSPPANTERIAAASAAAAAVAKDLAAATVPPPAGPTADEMLASVRARILETAPRKPRAAEIPAVAQSSALVERKSQEFAADAAWQDKEAPAVTLTTTKPIAAPSGTPAEPNRAVTPPAASAFGGPATPADLMMPAQTSAPNIQPPLPLVPASAQRSGPPPMPLPTVSNGPPPPPSRPPHALAPQALAPKAPPPMQPSMAPQPSPPTLNRNQAPVPSIPPPNVDMRALMAALPKRMREGETVLVEISVPRRALEIPLTPGHRWPPLRVATMRLKGAPDDVHLELASPETLWISPPRVHQGADDAAWRWRLTPRTAGRLKVTLAGATRIVGGEGISGEIPLGEESVEIDVLQRGSRRGFVGLLLFGNLLALGLLAMIMSGRAEELLFAAWTGIRGMIGGG